MTDVCVKVPKVTTPLERAHTIATKLKTIGALPSHTDAKAAAQAALLPHTLAKGDD